MPFMYKPNCTLYICSGTGLDMGNSIWWHKFAYPWGDQDSPDQTWWSAEFEFIKAHSIANGFWYLTNVRPEQGYIDIGRTQLQTSIEWGDSSLGNASKQAEIENEAIPFSEAIKGSDYLVFANGDDFGSKSYMGDPWYAFIDRVDFINQNVARVWYTIDAIMTFQKNMYLGKCSVNRDMQFQERIMEDGQMNPDEVNYQPEPIEPDPTNFVHQRCYGTSGLMTKLDLGPYSAMFVATDVDLANIGNKFITGIPSFEPSASTQLMHGTRSGDSISWDRLAELGIGVYYVKDRENEYFKQLGAYNAFEHLLTSYSVPEKIINKEELDGLADTQDGIYGVYIDYLHANHDYSDAIYDLKLPVYYDDDATLELQDDSNAYPDNPEGKFKPLNLKTHFAPYNYVSVTDKQGNSVEVQPQAFDPQLSTGKSLIQGKAHFYLTYMPNMLSMFYFDGITQTNGSYVSPLLTLWQIPTYAMTPNNSGYMNDFWRGIQSATTGITEVAIGGAGSVFIGAVQGSWGQMLPYYANIPGKSGAWAGARQATFQAGSTVTSSIESGGVNALLQGVQHMNDFAFNKMFGLPKALGGLPNGKSLYNLWFAGYEIYRIHLRTELLKNIDLFFSVFGYSQSKFRFPHVNIRKRWCFVKCDNVNLLPLGANNYDFAGIPSEYKNQIIQRLTTGITFWNVRQGISEQLGIDDRNPCPSISWSDSAIQALKGCKFVQNYGDGTPDSDIMKENQSFKTSGYADYYSDDYDINAQGD